MNKKEKTLGRIKSNIKTVATLTVGLGVGEIVASAVKDYKADAKGLNKLFVKLGAVALTGMIVSAVSKYVEDQIDEVFDEGQKMYERLNNLAAQEEENEEIEETEDATTEEEETKSTIEDYIFKNREDAEDISEQFRIAIDKFGFLTEEQAKDILGIEAPPSNSHYGWRNLNSMKIMMSYTREGYYIQMPRMVRLE